MLTVDVEQLLAQVAQLCCGGCAAIDPGPALALAIHSTAQEQVAGGVKTCLVEPVLDRRAGAELGAHVGSLGALAHSTCIGARARDQL